MIAFLQRRFLRLLVPLGCAALYACGASQDPAPASAEPAASSFAEEQPAARVAARAPGSSALRWTRRSENGAFEITLSPRQGEAPIGPLHDWVVQLRDAAGDAVVPASIAIGGGMPGHGHGLPTQPQVTRHLGDGRYLIEGLQFNMAGDWVLTVAIEANEGRVRDRARFEFTLVF